MLIVPDWLARLTNINVPLVAMSVPALMMVFEIVPKEPTVPVLVRLPPARTPPVRRIVPLFAHAGMTFKVRLPTLSVPLFTGANERLASLLNVNVPRLTRLLLSAPVRKNEPVLVTGPLKNVLADRNTVPALLKPLLTD